MTDTSPSVASTGSFNTVTNLADVSTPDLLAELNRRYGRFALQKEKRIIFIGAPGSGKGTQCSLVKERFHIAHLSTGDMLREAVAAGTDLGLKAKAVMEKGDLVSDEIVLGFIERKLVELSNSSSTESKGYLLDGFPRTVKQAIELDSLTVKLQQPIGAVVYFDIPDALLIERVCGRRVHTASGRIYHIKYNPPRIEGVDDVTGEPLTHRKDDNEEALVKRLEVFHKQTVPIIDYYDRKGILHVVDARDDVSEVSRNLMGILGDLNFSLGSPAVAKAI